MGSQNEMMIQTREPINGVITHSGGAKVEEGVSSREPCAFLGNLPELTLLGRKEFEWTE